MPPLKLYDQRNGETIFMQKIDMHCHILPGIDDGPKTIEQAIKMLELASKDGITHILATPHFHYRKGNATPERIRGTVEELQGAANAVGIPIRVYPGNELYYTQELLELVKKEQVLTLADSDYVLLEFSIETEKRTIQNAVYEFRSAGFYPIIAHMERYSAFQKDPEFIENILEMGAYYQIDLGSFQGDAGWKMKRLSQRIMKEGMLHFVATDAHDLLKRRPEFGKWADWVTKRHGKEMLVQLLDKNPEMILKNIAI